MVGQMLGNYGIVKLMINHRIAKNKPFFIRIGFLLFGPLIIRFFGYPFNNCSRDRAKLVMQYLEPKKDETILDFGCGIGYYCFELNKKYGCKTIGVDIDNEDIDLADKIKRLLRLKNIDFIKGSLDYKKYASFFDKIIVSEVLEHIEDDKYIIENLTSLLKKDGKMIVTVPFSRNPIEFKEQHKKLSGVEGGHVRSGYNVEYFIKKLANLPLHIIGENYSCKGTNLILTLKRS